MVGSHTTMSVSGMRDCSFCAEPVRNAAVLCPHCRSDLPPFEYVKAKPGKSERALARPRSFGKLIEPWAFQEQTDAAIRPALRCRELHEVLGHCLGFCASASIFACSNPKVSSSQSLFHSALNASDPA